MKKKLFTKESLLRVALAAAYVIVVVAMLPRPNKQEFSYELNQPWRYPLLTASFDVPVMRDSASARLMRDSIDRVFVPFVRRTDKRAEQIVERFRKAAAEVADPAQANVVTAELRDVYRNGIIDNSLYDIITAQGTGFLRTADNGGPENSISHIAASKMLTPRKAYEYIDSAYNVRMAGTKQPHLSAELGKVLSVSLVPNVVVDTVTDLKFRNQEYLNANGALGLIKQGQRIIDRGEIVTPQVFTILNTYSEMRAREASDSHFAIYYYLGQVFYMIVLITTLFLFLSHYRRKIYDDLRSMTFIVCYLVLFQLLAVVLSSSLVSGLFIVPYAAVPVVIMVFFDSRTAIFALLTSVLSSAILAVYPFSFIFMEMMVGLVATFTIENLSRRSQLLRTAVICFLMYVVCYVITTMLNDGNLDGINPRIIGVFAINSVLLSFAYILVFVVERVFGFTSTVTLVELSDINGKLLRRLAEEAPGTFQHSMQVSILASEGARAIGANTQLVRTGALYHDIGKLESPVFFTENQHGVNPHAGLDPETSARKIVSHVTEGLQLAQKEKLPQVIRDFITEHHGRGVTKYFYNTALNEAGEGESVDPAPFTYPGPNPRSRETAILMMADAVEAASRSLKDYSPQSISSLVDKIIDGQMNEGLFRDSDISFRDVEVVKETFKKRLANIYHSRVSYPEARRKAETTETEEVK